MPFNQNGRGPKLTEEQRRFAVCCFARWKTPQQAADLLEQAYGVRVSRQGIAAYSPRHNSRISAVWRAIHDAERQRFIADLSDIPIAFTSYRLAQLQEILDRATAAGDTAGMLAALDQAAKEVGGFYVRASRAIGRNLERHLLDREHQKPPVVVRPWPPPALAARRKAGSRALEGLERISATTGRK